MFITPIPPTSSEIAATAPSRVVKTSVLASEASRTAPWLMTWKPGLVGSATCLRSVRIAVTSAWAASSASRVLGLDRDRAQAARVAGQRVLDRGQRRERDVVLVLLAVGALGVGHADDLERGAVDAHALADGVGAAEQVLHDRRPEHDHALVLLDVLGGEHRAARDVVGARLRVAGDGAGEGARLVAGGAADERRPGRVDDGRDALDVGRVERSPARRRPWCVKLTPPPPPPPGPKRPPWGCTSRTLEPSALMRSWTASLEPLPTATRMITAATPIVMPRIVRPERSLFAATPASAIRRISGPLISSTRPR